MSQLRLFDPERFFRPIPDLAAYERSAAWSIRRARHVLTFPRCAVCGRGAPAVIVHVHHRTYARLGHEAPEDLVTLCESCHRKLHGRARGPAS